MMPNFENMEFIRGVLVRKGVWAVKVEESNIHFFNSFRKKGTLKEVGGFIIRTDGYPYSTDDKVFYWVKSIGIDMKLIPFETAFIIGENLELMERFFDDKKKGVEKRGTLYEAIKHQIARTEKELNELKRIVSKLEKSEE